MQRFSDRVWLVTVGLVLLFGGGWFVQRSVRAHFLKEFEDARALAAARQTALEQQAIAVQRQRMVDSLQRVEAIQDHERLVAKQDAATARARYDALRARLAADTVTDVHGIDTARVAGRDSLVHETLSAADAAVTQATAATQACEVTLLTCTQRAAAAEAAKAATDSVVVAKDAEIRILRQQQPTGFRRFLRKVELVAVGVGGIVLGAWLR